jgi:hypothetical protein
MAIGSGQLNSKEKISEGEKADVFLLHFLSQQNPQIAITCRQ